MRPSLLTVARAGARATVMIAFTLGFIAAGAAPATAVIGGADAPDGFAPYLVGLHFKSFIDQGVPDAFYASQFCGGSLVAPNKVVTAAHCVVQGGRVLKPNQIVVGSGLTMKADAGYNIVNVTGIAVEPSYDNFEGVNDIAVLTLASQPVGSTPIRMALPWLPHDYAAGKEVTVAGWGVTDTSGAAVALPYRAKYATVKIAPRSACGGKRPKGYVLDGLSVSGLYYKPLVRKPGISTLCALGYNPVTAVVSDTCQGDSGGPMVDPSSGRLIGVVSWGKGCASTTPGAYTNVASYYPFLYDNGAVLPE